MANIGGGYPRTIQKVNFMKFTCTMRSINMINGLKKNRRRYNPTKKPGNSVHGIVKTQQKVAEVENVSLCPHIFSLNFAMIV